MPPEGDADVGSCYLALTAAEAQARIIELGGKSFHARIVRRELLERGVLDYQEMSGLSKELRTRLGAELPLLSSVEVDRSHSSDGTTKLLLGLARNARVEMVHMPSRRADRGATVCISTQVGCPVGCPFCASGREGLERNLGAHEIAEQLLLARSLGPVSRCVVMGIGEPLLNFKNLLTALEVVREGMQLGSRKVTVSTVGFPDLLRRLAPSKPPFQLAISLHTAFDEQRAELVPAMAKVSVEEVLLAGDHWFETTGREITYEVCLLGEENDSERHAEHLAERLAGRRATVNLIPYNPVHGDRFSRPSSERVQAFHDALEERGVNATVRWSRGLGADAACGQLRLRSV